MKASIVACIISTAATIFAAPAGPATADAPTAVEAFDEPATLVKDSVTTTVYPSLQVRWKSKDPNTRARNNNVGHLLSNPNEQVHTSVYFAFTEAQAAGKTCRLVFRLSQDDWAIGPNGSPAVFDFYRLGGCLNEGYSWSSRPPRAIHAGVITPVKGKDANWQQVDMTADKTEPPMLAAPTFPCKAGEYSFELIARPGSNIGWTSGRGSGVSIEMY